MEGVLKGRVLFWRRISTKPRKKSFWQLLLSHKLFTL